MTGGGVMMKRLPALLALSALCGAAGAPAAPSAPATYLVQLTLKRGDALIGSPRLVVAKGQTARAAASNANGERYEISLSLSKHKGPSYLVKLALDTVSPEGRTYHAEPATLVKSGEPSALTLGGDRAAPLALALTVTPVMAPANL